MEIVRGGPKFFFFFFFKRNKTKKCLCSVSYLRNYEACPQNVSDFFHVENTFIGNACYIDGKAGLSAIFRRDHCCDRCTFACAVAFFVYPCHRTMGGSPGELSEELVT